MEIKVKDKLILIDEEDCIYTNLPSSSIFINSHGYAVVNTWDKVKKKNIKRNLHRYILGITNKNIDIDHINGDKLDNRKCNLRIATASENAVNSKMRVNNTSGYKGVFWHKHSGKWMASITKNKKHIYLGLFESKHEAVKAYDTKAIELFGEFATPNMPQLSGVKPL
jgi:hypothetical protein